MDAIHQRIESTVIIGIALRLRCWVRRSVWLLSRHKPALPLQNGRPPITVKTYVAPELAANSGEIRQSDYAVCAAYSDDNRPFALLGVSDANMLN